jgi:hypothetical protein
MTQRVADEIAGPKYVKRECDEVNMNESSFTLIVDARCPGFIVPVESTAYK